LEARHAGRRKHKGWAAAGPQRPAYSGRGYIMSPHAQLVIQEVVLVLMFMRVQNANDNGMQVAM